jgi:aminomethyltransferase
MTDSAPLFGPDRPSPQLTGGLAVPRPTRILAPGLARRSPRGERYTVPGGGAIVFAALPGDRLTVRDPEGGQVCEMVAFAADGRADPGLIATGEGRTVAAGERGPLSDPGSTEAMTAALRRRGLDIRNARALRLFQADGAPGAAVTFSVGEPLTLVVSAPGGPMAADAQNPPTEIVVEVERAVVPDSSHMPLPEPLAEPRLELRVDRCTASDYEVRAGEYIQIIDVAGRQCSDFLAFDRRGLDRGHELGLDATTTRTLMGNAYPTPGLVSKFYDPAMQPLVEVVRDTVGRHDTFALACTAKYYEDMGYPGHVNCSDNFSRALADRGVAARRGWPAINFFYNTNFDDQLVLYLDEPWSRPGDYVVLRAFTDLVCASSACPDDIDAANGWDPTDIHVRVYAAEHSFSKAVAYRMTPDADPKLTKETGFHPRTAALTRDFAEYRGYWLANSYTDYGAIDEYWACRERAAVIDLSALRKFEVVGPDAEQLLQYALTRNVRRLADGQVSYTALCYDTGGMLDDGTVMRLGPDNFRLVCGDEYCGQWLRELAAKLDLQVRVKSSTDQLHNISVQGPRSRDILARIVWTPPNRPSLAELGWFRLTVGRIGDHNGLPIVVTRTGYTGELGYEVWCHPTDAPAVWDAVFEAGADDGIAPLGLAALDILRIEAGLVFYGHEFCDQTDPFEAGIGFTVPLKSKEDDFVGRAALIERKAHPQRRLVGLEIDGHEVAGHGDCVHVGRAQVGVVTSGTRSPILKKTIALARMDVRHAELGTEVEVGKLDGHQKRLPAKIVPFPFYDPEKTRVRG